MKPFATALVYLGFFALIGGAVYVTESAWCLWALMLMPSSKDTNTHSQPLEAINRINENFSE